MSNSTEDEDAFAQIVAGIEDNSTLSNEEAEKLTDEYGVILSCLSDYFPTAENPEDKSSEFIKDYRLTGEANVRYTGVEEQLKKAIKRPIEFSKILNYTMGYNFTPEETREYMIDLFNRLTDVDEQKLKAKQDTDALMGYYAKRSLHLPFNVPKFGKNIPLWVLLLFFVVLGGLGWAGDTFIKVPILQQIFFLLLIIGALGMLVVAAIMYWLRDEVVNADKYEERDIALQEYREARKKKRQTSRWRIKRD